MPFGPNGCLFCADSRATRRAYMLLMKAVLFLAQIQDPVERAYDLSVDAGI